MVIVDANPIIRIILNDNETMVKETKEIIKTNQVLIKNEVMAEIIYVLLKVYRVSRTDVFKCISDLIRVDNINVESEAVMEHSLNTFKGKSIDFVDCLLYAYHVKDGSEIFTFDKGIKNLMNRKGC